MKLFLCLMLSLALSACATETNPMSNEQIVETVKYCEDNGMKPVFFVQRLTGITVRIECRPANLEEQ